MAEAAPTGPEVAVGGIVVHDGALLLVRRGRAPGRGQWSVPGGRVRPGETLHEAVVREVAEETGLEVAVDRFVGWTERIGADGKHHFVILDFLALPADPEPLPSPADDAVDARFVDLDEVAEYDLVADLYEFLVDHAIIDPARRVEW